jgi:hypothetical protein
MVAEVLMILRRRNTPVRGVLENIPVHTILGMRSGDSIHVFNQSLP